MMRFLILVAMALALASCGRRGDIAPTEGRLEDPRVRAFRIEEERRLEQERAQYRITRSVTTRANDAEAAAEAEDRAPGGETGSKVEEAKEKSPPGEDGRRL